MLYELVTLKCPLLSVEQAIQGAHAWIKDAKTKCDLLGCWRTEFGILGEVFILRRFETSDSVTIERRRALLSKNPFNALGNATTLNMEIYAPFEFISPERTDNHGNIYEFRTYHIRVGGLPDIMDAWEKAIQPASEYTSHLMVNMFAMDGRPRITHIWSFASLEERSRLRSRAIEAGVWPPRGGPEQIEIATSTIATPAMILL